MKWWPRSEIRQPGGKGGACQPPGVTDDLPDQLLAWRLLVAAAVAAGDPQLRERVAVDQPAGLRRRGVVEHRAQALHRLGAPAAREPRGDHTVVDLVDRQIAVALHERLGQLAATNVA